MDIICSLWICYDCIFFITSSLVYCVTVTLKIYKLIFLYCIVYVGSNFILVRALYPIPAQPSYKKKTIIAISILHLNQCHFCSCSYLAISSQKTRSQIKYLVKTSACSLCPRNTALERLQVGSCWYHFVIDGWVPLNTMGKILSPSRDEMEQHCTNLRHSAFFISNSHISLYHLMFKTHTNAGIF